MSALTTPGMSIRPVPTGTDEKKYHSSGRTWRQASTSLVCVATVYGPNRLAAATGSSIIRSVLPVSKFTFRASEPTRSRICWISSDV